MLLFDNHKFLFDSIKFIMTVEKSLIVDKILALEGFDKFKFLL